MIYDKHDLALNAKTAIQYGDNEALKDIFLNAVADGILKNKVNVVKAIRALKIKVSDSPSNNELARIIAENIKDKKFVSVIFEAINKEAYANAIDPLTGATEAVSSLGNLFGTIIGGSQQKKISAATNEAAIKAEKEKTKQALLGYLASKSGQKSNTGLYWGAAIGTLILAGIIITIIAVKPKNS